MTDHQRGDLVWIGVRGIENFDDYLMLRRDEIELHFFLFKGLDPHKNYGQVYIRVYHIEEFYQQLVKDGVMIHPNGPLATKPWGQREFSLLDPDGNLLTFGESALGPLDNAANE